ncbi:hypothetical protein GGF46_001525 [Coemansia sp. RSA 552]|nr:hypothetical protein GGF46_001525 [Coemansia sp. RSA 552]
MLSLARSAFATIGQLRVSPPGQACMYASRAKTGVLKAQEKSKFRRRRLNKPDKPAQAKRNPRVSKL